MEEKLVAAATAHTRCAMRCTQEKAGTRLKHAPPALRTGAGTSRAGFEKKVPARGRAAVRSTTNCGKSECCAARTRPARSALPLRTSRHPPPCFTPSLSMCFCSQSLRVPVSCAQYLFKKYCQHQTCTRCMFDGAPGILSMLSACARMRLPAVSRYLRDAERKSGGQHG